MWNGGQLAVRGVILGKGLESGPWPFNVNVNEGLGVAEDGGVEAEDDRR